MYLGDLNKAGYTTARKVKQATSLITQELNATLKKQMEDNVSALAEAETPKFRIADMDKTMALMNKKNYITWHRLRCPGSLRSTCSLLDDVIEVCQKYTYKSQ